MLLAWARPFNGASFYMHYDVYFNYSVFVFVYNVVWFTEL